MVMGVRWYDAERIAQYGRSRATLDAIERRDQASIRPVSPGGRHGHQFWLKKNELCRCEIAFYS